MQGCTCRVRVHDVVVLTSAGCVRLLISGLWFTPGILYVAFLNEFQHTAGVTSWITTLQYFSSCIMCVVGGLLVKRLGCRLVTASGGIMLSAGLLTSMWASHISHIFLTYGVLSGLGSGLAYIGSMQALNLQIHKFRNVLFGLCAFTGNLGVMLYPPLLQTLIDNYTWRGMFLVLAAFELNVAAVALVGVSKRTVTIEHRIGEGEEGEEKGVNGEDGKSLLNGRIHVERCVGNEVGDGENVVASSEVGEEMTLFRTAVDDENHKGEVKCYMDDEHSVKEAAVCEDRSEDTFLHSTVSKDNLDNQGHYEQSADVKEFETGDEHCCKEIVSNSANEHITRNAQEDDELGVWDKEDTADKELPIQNIDRDVLSNHDIDDKADGRISFVESNNIFNLENSKGKATLSTQDGVRERLLGNHSDFNGKQFDERTSERKLAKRKESEVRHATEIKTKSFLDENAFLKDVHFLLYLLSGTLFLFGTSIVLGHLSAYIVSHKLSDKLGASMVYTVNALTMAFAKLLQGFLIGDNRLQPWTLHAILTGTGGVVSFIFLFELSLPVVYTYVVVFGACNSAVGGALMPAMVTKMAASQCFAFALGLTACVTAVGSLLGAPVAGWIFDSTQSYVMPFLVSAIAMSLACAVMLASIWMKRISNSRANSRVVT